MRNIICQNGSKGVDGPREADNNSGLVDVFIIQKSNEDRNSGCGYELMYFDVEEECYSKQCPSVGESMEDVGVEEEVES